MTDEKQSFYPEEYYDFMDRFFREGFVNELPPQLHHYTDSAGLNGTIIRKQIWLTSFKFMNDSQELRYGMKILAAKFKDALKRSAFDAGFKDSLTKMWDDVEKNAHDPDIKPLIFCLSEKEDHLSQWRGYGDFGRGFRISFISKELQKWEHSDQIYLAKVQYKPAMFEALCADMVQNWFKLCETTARKNQNSIPKGVMIDLALLLLQATYFLCICFKHHGFEEEAEWRLVKFVRRGSSELKYRPHRFGAADYFEHQITPESLISEVMSGPTGPDVSYLSSSLPAGIKFQKSPTPFV